MKHKSASTLLVLAPIAAAIFCAAAYAASTPAGETRGAREGESAKKDGGLTPISPPAMDWVKRKLTAGQSVLLTNAYMFQVAKGVAQRNQKLVEERALAPLLERTLESLVNAVSDDPDAKRLFMIPLVMLKEDPAGAPEDILSIAGQLKEHPLFKPVGHYTESDTLERYFRGMRFLTMATVDVSINKPLFPGPPETLFPFKTGRTVAAVLARPEHAQTLGDWKNIHRFYNRMSGNPDGLTFWDLATLARHKGVTKAAVEQKAKTAKRTMINPEVGLGVQPFGERFTLHQGLIDDYKRRHLKDDMSREEMAQLLAFDRIAAGKGLEAGGLAARIKVMSAHAVKGKAKKATTNYYEPNYYDAALKAVAAAGAWNTREDLNFAAVCLTSLAEQTALTAKVSTLVSKGMNAAHAPDGLNLRFEPAAHSLLAALAAALDQAVIACEDALKVSGVTPTEGRGLIDAAPAFQAFAVLAKKSDPLVTGTEEWKKYGALVEELPRSPIAAVDVFRFKDRAGKTHFHQWLIAPYETQMKVRGAEAPLPAFVMVFFDGWSDQIVPESEGPLDNAQWETRIMEGDLGGLRSILPLD